MKSIDFKSLAVIEATVFICIGLFSLDFLPRNYGEFLGICSQTWPKDLKQYQICMEPYYRQTGLDKYAIGILVGALIVLPIFYIFKKKSK
jgi:hypothetical protein